MGVVAIAHTDILKPVLVIYVGTREWARCTNRDGVFLIPTDDGYIWLRLFWRKVKPSAMVGGWLCRIRSRQ